MTTMRERTIESVRAARVAAGHALRDMGNDPDVSFDAYVDFQEEVYFDLWWHERALSEGFIAEQFQPTGYHVDDEYVSVFGGFKAADPRNPTTERVVHVDHLVYDDGSVEVQVNGDTLDVLTEPAGEPMV